MKLYRRHSAFIIESALIVSISGFIAAGKYGYIQAKAAAFFPFVFVRSEEYATPVLVNHERIHFRQQLELLCIGFWLLSLYETIYAKFALKLNAKERYLYRAAEQEAYCNQENLQYLKQRKFFSVFKYVRNKTDLSRVVGA